LRCNIDQDLAKKRKERKRKGKGESEKESERASPPMCVVYEIFLKSVLNTYLTKSFKKNLLRCSRTSKKGKENK
jgi:hypothetical protein